MLSVISVPVGQLEFQSMCVGSFYIEHSCRLEKMAKPETIAHKPLLEVSSFVR
jgi:hypothetical protein